MKTQNLFIASCSLYQLHSTSVPSSLPTPKISLSIMKANPKLDFQIQNFKKTLHEKRILLQNFRFWKISHSLFTISTWAHWRQSYINRISRCQKGRCEILPDSAKFSKNRFWLSSGQSMFGTAVTSAPSCGLRHQMLTSTPSSIEMLTSAP